jgi:RHS repeat-associated protein
MRHRVWAASVTLMLGGILRLWAQTCPTIPSACTPPEHPTPQCFPYPDPYPVEWQDDILTWQTMNHPRSLASTCTPNPNVIGYPLQPATPPSIGLRVEGTRILVDYDLPDFFCTIVDAWPPGYGCTNDPILLNVQLGFGIGGQATQFAYIYYENGTWDPGVDLACGSSPTTYTASVKYMVIVPGGTTQVISATTTKTLTPHCGDRRTCPVGTSVSEPINVGSGDVMVAVPMFSINSQPMSLPFTLSYHSELPNYPTLVSSPVGLGWSHPYSQSLRATDGSTDGTGKTLYHITAEGFESEYAQRPGDAAGTWTASSPGELRGTVTLVGIGPTGEYQLTDLDGTLTAFDLQTGHWKRTQDRWGNQIVGTYSAGNLTAITDVQGRQISFSYTASQVTITLPGGPVWKLALSSGLLTGIFDPLHTGATPWRSFTYLADHAIPPATRLLSTMTDDASKVLEQHTYDPQDRGISGFAQGGTSNVTIQYDYPTQGQRRVIHTIDASTAQIADFTMVYQMGRWLPTLIQGSCATCSAGGADQTSFTYDHFNNQPLKKIVGTGSDQVETDYTYDANALVLSRVEAVGRPEERATTYNYALGTPGGFLAPWPRFLTAVTDSSVVTGACCHSISYNWSQADDCLGQGPERCLEVTETGWVTTGILSNGGQRSYTTSTLYDTRHRQTNVIGPNPGQAADLSYYPDAATNNGGRLASTVAHPTPSSSLTTAYDIYDLFGTAKKIVDPNGVETDATTDSRGRVATRTSLHVTGDSSEATDYTTTYTFDSRDRLTDVLLPRGNKTHYAYEDGTNRLTDTLRVDTGGLQQERLHIVLNTIGGKVTEQAQTCNTPATSCAAWTTKRTESYSYDTNNRLHSVTHPDGSSILYTYDSRANVQSVQDERHTAANTIYAYDGLNRLKSVVQKQTLVSGADVVTSYQYNDHDDLAQVMDPNGNVTTYQYNDFRRMEGQASPVSGNSAYAYDPAGDLISVADGNSALTNRTYDGLLRPLTATASAGGKVTEITTWTYDQPGTSTYGLGRLTTMLDSVGMTQYSYERRGLPKVETMSFPASLSSSSYTTSYGYDSNGNRRSVTYPSGNAVTFAFDFADRPTSVRNTSTVYVSSATYLPFGPLKDVTYGNGTSRSGTFDQRYQPQELKLVKGATTLADHTYQFDGSGNVLQLHDALAAAYNRDFGYDDLNRLTTANSGTSLWGTGSYTYDAMGNMKTLNLGGASRAAQFSYVGATPKLASVREASTRNVTYDAGGNETAVGTSAFVYSARNLLVDGDGNSYMYDGRGLRRVVNMGGGIPLLSLTVSPSSVVAGTAASGTVALSVKAPVGGASVSLSSSDTSAATVPSTVTVAADFSAVGFTVTTLPVGTVKTVTITASFAGTTKTATLTVTPSIAVTGLTLSPTSVVGGNNSVGTVTLNAPSQATTVTLSSSNTNAATVPASIIVPYGNLSTTFAITTKGVAATATSSITASTPSGSRASTLTVTSASLTNMSLSPLSIPAGTTSTGTLTFNGQTPPGGATVSLNSTVATVATVPTSATVPGGATSGTFLATGVAIGSSAIKATYGANNYTQNLTVTAPVIASVTVLPSGVNAGGSSSGFVTLTAPVSSIATVSLSSSSAYATLNPSSVTVAAGQSVSQTFTISTSSSAPPTSVTITGTYPTGTSKTATLQILNDGSSTIYTIQTPSGSGTGASERGTSFHSSQSGYITALRFYKSDTATSHTMRLWGTDPLAPALATLTISNESVGGWQEADLPVSVPITAGTVYRVSYSAGSTYAKTTNGLNPPIVHGFLTTNNGVSGTTGQFPGTTSSDSFFADVRFSVAPLSGVGLLGNYYANSDLTGPQFCRVDPKVDFNWPTGYPFSPPPATPDDTFSVRWSGKVQPQFTETYTFYTTTDDGVRLWVNNQLLIDKWVQQVPTEWSGQIALVEGAQYDMRLEFFDGGSNADAHLSWQSPSRSKEIIPPTRLLPSNGISVSLTSPSAGSGFPAGGTVTLTATATAGLGIAKVQYFHGGTNLIGESTGPSPYAFNWTGVPAGSYSITAVATDTAGCSVTSTPVTISVAPLAVSSLTLSPAYASAGQTVTGTVTMNVAPQATTTVALANPNTALMSMPSTTTVNASSLTGTFQVTVLGNVPGYTPYGTTIAASVTGSTATATLKLEPRLLDLRVWTLAAFGPGSANAMVTMTGGTADRAIAVSLTSSNTNVATVPPTVTVPASNQWGSFLITTKSVTSPASVTISATLGSVTKTFDLVVNPGGTYGQEVTVDAASFVGGDDVVITANRVSGFSTWGSVWFLLSGSGVQNGLYVINIPPLYTYWTLNLPTEAVTSPKTITMSPVNGGCCDVHFTLVPAATVTPGTGLTVSPSSISCPNVTLGSVSLSAPADAGFNFGGLTLTSSSSKAQPGVAQFGNLSTSANFYVSCPNPVDAQEQVTITAQASGPPVMATFQLIPQSAELRLLGGREEWASLDLEEERTKTTPELASFHLASLNSDALWSLRAEWRDSGYESPSRDYVEFMVPETSAAPEARPKTAAPSGTRFSFYSPEMNLLAETELKTPPLTQPPGIVYEYIWFGGIPVAQVDTGTVTHWTFTDHLGTPIIQTDSNGTMYWQAEYEPYGKVWALRTADQHQPLRLPGQEAEQLNLGANGATERFYNVFRWYRYGWGRYNQADPIGLDAGVNVFAYTFENPVVGYDPSGLAPCQKNAALAGCDNPTSSCCVAKCVDDLRFSLCLMNSFKTGFRVIGVAGGIGAGIKIGGKIGGILGGPEGLVVGACVGGAVGGVMGYYGLWRSYYGIQWEIARAGRQAEFRKCMEQNCGYNCKPGGFCLTQGLFNQLSSEGH